MDPRDCLCLSARRAARALSRTYDQALAPVGLKNTQFSVLYALQEMGPTPLGQLAEFLVMERTTLTRNLVPLEREGWVRTASGSDRRQRLVELAPPGRGVLERALPLWREVQGAVRRGLGAGRADRLVDELRDVAGRIS